MWCSEGKNREIGQYLWGEEGRNLVLWGGDGGGVSGKYCLTWNRNDETGINRVRVTSGKERGQSVLSRGRSTCKAGGRKGQHRQDAMQRVKRDGC